MSDFESPTWLKNQRRTFRKDLKQYRDDDHHHGVDISKKVDALSERNFGLSAKVSQGKRPPHTAKDSSRGSGIDDNSPRLGRKDWR
jgi:hypothetical protein